MATNTYYVHIPTKSQRQLIDTIAKYVSKYGDDFEREFITRISAENDLRYTFLLNEYTPENVYYKWRVYSFTQGDTSDNWHTDPYWIFKGGSKWIPPALPNSIEAKLKTENVENVLSVYGSKQLTSQQTELLLDKVAKVTSKRSSVCEAMVYIIELSEYAIQVSQHLIDSILNNSDISVKLYRLFLLSDVLHNTSCSKPLSWVYSSVFEKRLPEVFDHFSKLAHKSGKISKGLIIDNLYNLVKIWDSWSIYSTWFIRALHFTITSEPVENIASVKLPHHLLDNNVDGKALIDSEVLFKLPLKYRKHAYKYLNLSLERLKSTCLNIGLYSGGLREELLLRLAALDLSLSNEHFTPPKPKPVTEPPKPDVIAEVKHEPSVTSIEIDRDFEESDMETMSDSE